MDNEKLHDCNCGNDHEHEHEHEHCGCGCGCDENEAMIVELEDENGNIVPCEVVEQFTYKENEYVLVQNPEDGSVYMFKVVETDGNSELVIPDDEEFEEVSSYYEQTLEQEE